MSDEAKKMTCGAQTTARDILGDIVVECALEKGHDQPRKVTPWMGVETLPGTPHRFSVEWL